MAEDISEWIADLVRTSWSDIQSYAPLQVLLFDHRMPTLMLETIRTNQLRPFMRIGWR